MLLQEHVHILVGVLDQSGRCTVVERSPDLLTVDTIDLDSGATVVILMMLVLSAKVYIIGMVIYKSYPF